MQAHTAGKARGRYLCPVAGAVFTHGLGRSVELAEPMRLVFQPGWDTDRVEADPDRPGRNRPATYHRSEPEPSEQRNLDRAAGRVFGPGCVISRDFTPPPPGDRSHGRAGVYLIPAPGADPVTWFVNEPVAYKKCAACPAKVIASNQSRMDRDWVPARHSYWRGSGWRLRRAEISQGPHPAGSYACRDCHPGPQVTAQAQAQDGLPQPDGTTNPEPGGQPPAAADWAASGDASRAVAALASGRRAYGVRDEVTIRHWREAHLDPDKVRAWCRDTGRDDPPPHGPLPRDLVADYLAERGAGIPLPGGLDRTQWLARRPVLSEPFTVRLGPFTVVYGPCPRCGHPTAADPGQPLPVCTECATRSGDRDGSPAPPAGSGAPESTVSGRDAGQSGIPVPAGSDGDDDEASAQARITGQQLRQAAHRYLEAGLLPVPAWAAGQAGACCCPRGADCGRPGKHPRSVRSGPGPHDYSWKPLACRTHAEIDERFAPGGRYAAGNLMVAIPAGMMAIDIDDDDGGRAAAARLAGELGPLPSTLSHHTPHGEHLIYATPPGWTGRAWVGKDTANPVPPGIDLRMPGQILMAAPSVVPGPDAPVRYGPLTGHHVAGLPAAYVTAWTPPQPQPQPRPDGRRVPVPPDSADRAARYVHEAMTRIAADLASRQPGGRNAAAYAAGLKAGSLLGAARTTPGAEQAAAWTDEDAEQALLDAAETNGYTRKDGPAEARRAIRSGLRNGLRNPRTLPDFTRPSPATERRQPDRPAPAGAARPRRRQPPAASGPPAGRWQDLVPGDIRRELQAADTAARDRRRAAVAAHQRALERHHRSATADTAAEVERTRAAAHAAHQAYTRDGRHVTGRHDAAMLRWAGSIAAQPERQASAAGGGPQDSPRLQANRAAADANRAYRAGDLDRARQLTDQAPAADLSRAGLWQQHRDQIAARRLIHAARTAHADGDHQQAHKLLEDARQLDPRMPAVWDGDLPALSPARPGRRARDRDTAAAGPADAAGHGRSPAPDAGRGDHAPATLAQAGQEAPQPSRPRSPARRKPHHPAPDAASQVDKTQPPAPRPAAAPREPRARPRVAGHRADAGAEPDSDPAARWPAPNPRAARQTGPPAQQSRHEATTGQEAGPSTRISPAPEAGPGRTADANPPAQPSADWRDQVLSQARQPWHPAPGWPGNPALHRPPEPGTPDAGIEPSEPDASV
jgi:hypothetical protein